MKFLTSLSLILVVCAIATAQTFRIDAGASISTSHNLGYKNPDAGVYVNTFGRHGRFAAQGDFNYLPLARKIFPDGGGGTGNGHALSYSATGRIYLDDWNPWNGNIANHPSGRFYFAAGGRWIRQYTSVADYAVFRPAAGLGYDFTPTTRLQGLYEFKDKGPHRASVVSAEIEKRFGHFVFREEVALVRFDQEGRIRYGFRTGVEVGVGFSR